MLEAHPSWDALMRVLDEEIRERKIQVKKKKRGAINWLRFSERATMLPTRHGPMLLPWDWDGRSRRSQVRTLGHELTHHQQDRKVAFYEALYLHPGWRWAIEVQCFGFEVWLMVLSMRDDFASKPYSEGQVNKWMSRIASRIHKGYAMRRFDKTHVQKATRMALQAHYKAARKRLRGLS